MIFKLATILSNIPVVYVEDDDDYTSAYGVLNCDSVPPRGVVRMVSLIPAEPLITPIDSLREAVGFYDRSSDNITQLLDPSNLVANTADELISQLSKFYQYPGTTNLEPTQRSWFVNDRFKTAIRTLFNSETSEILKTAFADLAGKANIPEDDSE